MAKLSQEQQAEFRSLRGALDDNLRAQVANQAQLDYAKATDDEVRTRLIAARMAKTEELIESAETRINELQAICEGKGAA